MDDETFSKLLSEFLWVEKEMKNFVARHFESIVTVICIIVTGIFWIATMNGIPTRVARLESDVNTIKQQLSRTDTKTDIILEDTKFIKQLILEKHMK